MQVLARVSVKIGSITRTSRTNIRAENDEFQFDPEASYESLYASANERIEAALASYDTRTLRPDTNLYAKPSQGATQQDWVVLTAVNWRTVVTTVTTNYQRRRKDNRPLCLELFAFGKIKLEMQHGAVQHATEFNKQPRISANF
ncbi:LOW QUALITY PROTEIN: hypothetical protein PHMEG_00027508 [Phytophthora megakarya]|uniref:Uncharacterized protein n=1 Tax=Phytophthora megakarya TaxID=4795 RepID=A0A225V7S4_9STRA|nr:LOW QUALITY PROTEIN: hypothetical protein PHMEG_00027508 [Phytophthora megakarya]